MDNIDLFTKYLRSLSAKLLAYEPLQKIYDISRHSLPLSGVKTYSNLQRSDWLKIYGNYRNVLSGLQRYIDDDGYFGGPENEINSDLFDLYDLLIPETEILNLAVNDKELFIKTVLLANLYACCVFPRGVIQEVVDEELDLTRVPQNDSLYRGEDDYGYSLVPSVFREIGRTGGSRVINYSDLFAFYHNRHLISKYSEYKSFTEVDYEFCALMQHAGCKSPFLDCSTDHRVGLAFATESNDSKDGSLYVFNGVKDADSKTLKLRGMSVFITDRKLDLLTVVRRTPILLCDLSKFDVEICVLRAQTNDRMTFQKGAFLFMNKAIIVNGGLLLPITNRRIKKYRIPASDKLAISRKIEQKHPRYLYKYLMDPYLYFSDTL